jgi:hypothetical protein
MLSPRKRALACLYGGPTGWRYETPETFLGVGREEATIEHLKRLSLRELVQLFHAADPPQLDSVSGEYRGEILTAGVVGRLGAIYTDHLFGPGRWIGKAFLPVTVSSGQGLNLYATKNSAGLTKVLRDRRMATTTRRSNFDSKEAFHLDYSPYNDLPVSAFSDEIRRINDRLLLGMGCVGLKVGTFLPVPFGLYGAPHPWVGADDR